MSLDSYLQRDARLRIEIKVKLAELIRLGNAEKLRLAMKHHGYTVELRLRSGSVQNLAHERDTLRISLRFDRKVSPGTFGFVKDSVVDRPGSSNLGGVLEKAMQGNPRKRICVQHFEDVGRRLLTGENDRAVSQIWEPSVEGGHHGTGRGVCLWVQDGGIGFFPLQQHLRFWEPGSDDAVIPHRPQQNEQVVAHQRVRAQHQYLGHCSSAFGPECLSATHSE